MAGRPNPQYEGMLLARRQAAELERRYRSGEIARPQAAAPQQPQQAQPQQAQPQLVANPSLHVHMPRVDDRSDLERMGDGVEDALRDENYSRVAQAREQARMAHAKDIEAMRLDALTKRLGGYQQADDPQRGSPVSGMFKVWNPDMQRWEEGGNELRFGP